MRENDIYFETLLSELGIDETNAQLLGLFRSLKMASILISEINKSDDDMDCQCYDCHPCDDCDPTTIPCQKGFESACDTCDPCSDYYYAEDVDDGLMHNDYTRGFRKMNYQKDYVLKWQIRRFYVTSTLVRNTMANKFFRKLSADSEYCKISLPKPVYDMWIAKNYTHIQILYDSVNDELVVSPL